VSPSKTEIDEIRKRKNNLLLDLMQKRDVLNEKEYLNLNLEIADLEGQIARYHFAQKDLEKACVNLVSQASCYIKIRYYADALEVLNDITVFTCEAKLKAWAQNEMENIVTLMTMEEPNGVS
jgi:hypothetical protein